MVGNTASHVTQYLFVSSLLSTKYTILIKIGSQKTHALVDTGANISCIPKAFLKATDLKISKLQSHRKYGVGGEKHESLGKVEIPI